MSIKRLPVLILNISDWQYHFLILVSFMPCQSWLGYLMPKSGSQTPINYMVSSNK